jgi:4-amino-4-deoxy-L-arabinose transferase-like glycosyltransferase
MSKDERRLVAQIKAGLNRWRAAFLIFAVVYAVLLVLNLSNPPMMWDEAVHLNNVFLLKSGYNSFVSSSFYPPFFEVVTAVFFNFFGVSLFNGRLVTVIFSVLTLWVVFELAYSMYGKKAALLSAVLFGVMPGYFWLSGLALLEVMLLFFFTLSLFLFYRWLQNGQNRMLVFSGLALGLGFLTKYQVLAALAVTVFSLLVLGWGRLRRLFSRFSILVVTAVVVATPWIVMVYKVYASQILSQWAYALQVGNPARSLYSGRFPFPLFYLVEMTWPYSEVHPISLLLYVVGLLGLGLLVWQRKKADKFVLVWFASVFIFFTLIPNKEWRYALPLFPALAISASALIMFVFSKAQSTWQGQVSVKKKRAAKVAAGLFIMFLAVAFAYSVYDSYYWVESDNFQIDIQAATNYVIAHDNGSQAVMVLCPFDYFSQDMVNFYLWEAGNTQIQTCQYPELPVDTYTPTFNLTQFISLCSQNHVGYVFTYENGGAVPYFNTTLNLMQIYAQLYASGNFTKMSPQETFGFDPRRVSILNFTG